MLVTDVIYRIRYEVWYEYGKYTMDIIDGICYIIEKTIHFWPLDISVSTDSVSELSSASPNKCTHTLVW